MFRGQLFKAMKATRGVKVQVKLIKTATRRCVGLTVKQPRMVGVAGGISSSHVDTGPLQAGGRNAGEPQEERTRLPHFTMKELI